MKLKSLILGSAAALIAVTGARAADAVIAEPEPVEYVRVCDMFGTGFYYIPGTETCFRIDGYVWYQIGADSVRDAWNKSSRVRLNFDARSETEWGTLRGFIRLQATWNSNNQIQGVQVAVPGGPVLPNGVNGVFNYGNDGNVSVDQAIIELGGLRMGYTESAWAQTQNGGSSNWGSHSWSGMAYGYNQTQLIAYTFSGGNGFFGTVSVEDDGNSNYTPDVVAKVGVAQGWGTVWAKVAYDEDVIPAIVIPGNTFIAGGIYAPAGSFLSGRSGNSAWAASVGAHLNIPNMAGSSVRLIYFYGDKPSTYSVGARHSVIASYRQQFSATWAGSVGFQYMWNTGALNTTGTGSFAGGPNAYQIEGTVVWVPITNFEIRGEVYYTKVNGGGNGVTSGILRFTRFF